ncbi:hypothetical protein [Streptomyces sp. NPDC126499]|uniref:hypothetical protein n=1 Tax=Streptomyces sp. NPDC126499 TaxID=3155314 RepID=UPI0033250694
MKPLLLRLFTAVALVALTTGCGGAGGSAGHQEEKRNVSRKSLQEAAEHADAIILDSVSSVRPALNWVHGASTDIGCGDYTIDGKKTGSVTRRAEVMTIVSEARRGSLLGLVERHWKGRGYTITSVDASRELPAIYARTPDDFRMSVAVGAGGRFQFSVTTPCFLASDVQRPKTPAPGTPFEGPVVPDPSVRSSFWSVETSVPSGSSTP